MTERAIAVQVSKEQLERLQELAREHSLKSVTLSPLGMGSFHRGVLLLSSWSQPETGRAGEGEWLVDLDGTVLTAHGVSAGEENPPIPPPY